MAECNSSVDVNKEASKVRANERYKCNTQEVTHKGVKEMGYLLLLLFFLTWRNTVHIRKAVNYIAYGTERRRGIFSKLLDLITKIHNDEAEIKKAKKAAREAERAEKTEDKNSA